MKKILLVSIAILFTSILSAQNPLEGTWVGKYTMAYGDDDKFEHLPLPFVLSFTKDTMQIQYFDEIYTSEEIEKLHYSLNKNIIEFNEGDDAFQILLIGVSKDTLAIYGEDFEEGLLVFTKVKEKTKNSTSDLKLNNRSFVLQNSHKKVLDTFDFFPGNTLLQYNTTDHWSIDNYQIIKLGSDQYLDLHDDDFSFLKIINIEKSRITLINELQGEDTLILNEINRPKKTILTRTKWNLLNPEKPCKKITVGFNDTLLIVTSEKEDVHNNYADILSHYYWSCNGKFLLTLPDNYERLKLENQMILAGSYNIYQIKPISKDQLNLYNHNRDMSYNPLICGHEFEIRLLKAK